MNTFIQFLRLVRFGNLVVIALTMGIIQVFIAAHGNSLVNHTHDHLYLKDLSFAEGLFIKYNIHLDFLLAVLSVVFITAAGNVINDYFDVKADRVNKPERLIIGKYIKRRWAIMFNWLFNIAGLGIAIYLSAIKQNWWIALLAFLIINLLWFYSALYKRKLLIGNILVAFMVAMVPIYVLIFNLPLKSYAIENSLNGQIGGWFVIEVVGIVAIIAFFMNIIREIIKDIADIRGDLHLSAKTIPIVLGIKKTKIILLFIVTPLLALMIFYLYHIQHYQWVNLQKADFLNATSLTLFTTLISLSISFVIAAFTLLLSVNRRKIYLLSSNLLKLAMIFGIVSPLLLL